MTSTNQGTSVFRSAPRVSRTPILCLLIVFLIFLPSSAYADAGTPLVWAGMLHLLVGNLFIGILEAGTIAAFFGINKNVAQSLMIPANYFSMVAGLFVIPFARDHLFVPALAEISFYHIWLFLALLYFSFYILTVFLEWPFCFLAFTKITGRAKKSLKASFMAQAVSYAVLLPFYVLFSGGIFFNPVDTDPSVVSTSTDQGSVFFIHPKDGDVYKIRINGTGLQRILSLGAMDRDARLFLRQNENKKYDLWARLNVENNSERMLIRNVATHAAAESGEEQKENRTTFQNFGPAVDFRAEGQRNWRVWTGVWALEGLWARNERTNQKLQLGFEAPFLTDWISRNATVLPSGRVIYQLGPQIVLLELESCKIGLITEGRGPVVILDEPESEGQ